MDDDDDFVPIEVRPMPARKLSLLDFFITTFDCLASYIDAIVELFCQHANWKVERREVAAAMRADIERMVAGE